MKKNLILRLMLMTAFVLSFHSCRTDLEAITEHKTEPGEHIHQKISTATFQKETFLSGVNEFKRSANSLSGKSGSNSDYLKRFFIDETSIYKMDVNNIQTYALRAYNIFESPEVVYNLVYRKNGNDAAFSIVEIIDNELIPVYDSQKGIVTKIDNPSTARICTDFYSVEIWNCKENVSWDQCDKCAQCLFTSSGYTSYECGGGGGNTGGGGSFPGGGDTGGGGGGTGLYDPGGYTFDPNIPPSIEPSYVRAARANSFFYSLTDQAKSWAVEHSDIYCSILEYYLDHIPPSSPPPNSYYWDFANFAIQLFMENPALTWEQFYNQFINTPCQKTKAVVNDPKRQAGLTELMNKSKEGGEKAFMTKADGTPSPIIPGGEHSTDLGDITGYQGYSHNHTPDGIKMLSPPDIYKLFYFIVNQPTGTPVDAAFGEMVGTQVCPNCPGGYEYYNYIIRFNGSFADAQAIKDRNYTKADLEAFKDKFAEFELSLRPKSEYASQNGNFMNTKGLEEVFFNALDKMNIDKNKMILQKVDKNGNVTNVTLGADGKPKDVPCPN